MKIDALIMSCPERAAMCAQTIERLLATDWGETPDVVIDASDFERRQERQEHTAMRLLQAAIGRHHEVDFVLFLEDDVAFNNHLRHNLERWPPLLGTPPESHFLGSLYNPNIFQREVFFAWNCYEAEPEAVYGSQAFILSLTTAQYVVEHWSEVEGMQDIKISRLAARHCPILYHAPSLVQHVGYRSTWDGGWHSSSDYDGNWKAAP